MQIGMITGRIWKDRYARLRYKEERYEYTKGEWEAGSEEKGVKRVGGEGESGREGIERRRRKEGVEWGEGRAIEGES